MVQTSVSLDQKSDKTIGASWPREHPDYKSEEEKKTIQNLLSSIKASTVTVESKRALNVYNLIQEFYICIFNTGIITNTQNLSASATVKSYNKDKCECPDLIKQLILQGQGIFICIQIICFLVFGFGSGRLVFADNLVGNLCRKPIPQFLGTGDAIKTDIFLEKFPR